jgi:glycine oxidase
MPAKGAFAMGPPAAPPVEAVPTTADVVVVGGGTIGLSSAWRLATRGVDVVVVDPDPGGGASWSAAGMLAPVTELTYGEEELLALNLASRDRWPSFAEELATAATRDPHFRACGTVLVARDRDDREALDDLAAYMDELEVRVERLRAREIRELEPGLSPTVAGGLFAPDDHQVDNRALVEALLAACAATGVTTVRERVAGFETAGGRVTGVVVEPGASIAGDTVVVAAGAWSGELGGLPAGAIPVRPVKGQIAHLRGPADPALATRTIRGLDVYLVPRADGRVVVGASVEDLGFDTTITAGAVLDLLREAYALLPGLTELELIELSAGLRPGSPDNAPLIGPGPVDGMVVATGHHRNGILLTPVTADAVAALVADGALPPVAAPFDPGRFAAAGVVA